MPPLPAASTTIMPRAVARWTTSKTSCQYSIAINSHWSQLPSLQSVLLPGPWECTSISMISPRRAWVAASSIAAETGVDANRTVVAIPIWESGAIPVTPYPLSGAARTPATATVVLTLHHDALVFGAAYSPDGKYIATGSDDGIARIWDAETSSALHTLTGHTANIGMLTFSSDGKRLASASEDGTAKVWEVATGKTLLTLSGHTGVVGGAAFSPDGSLLATTSNDGTAKIWQVATGHELFTLAGHTGPVFGVAFSPDGRHLATSSVDRTVKIWDLSASSGAQPLTLYGHTAAIYRVAFSPDGTRLVTTSRDRTARVYALRIEDLVALAKTRITRSLTAEECQKYLHAQQCPPS